MCCKEILNASKLFTRGDFFNWKANSNARSFRILAALKWRGLCICRFVFELLAANGLLVWLLMLNGVLVLCSRQLCVIALRCLAAFLDLYVICFLFIFYLKCVSVKLLCVEFFLAEQLCIFVWMRQLKAIFNLFEIKKHFICEQKSIKNANNFFFYIFKWNFFLLILICSIFFK